MITYDDLTDDGSPSATAHDTEKTWRSHIRATNSSANDVKRKDATSIGFAPRSAPQPAHNERTDTDRESNLPMVNDDKADHNGARNILNAVPRCSALKPARAKRWGQTSHGVWTKDGQPSPASEAPTVNVTSDPISSRTEVVQRSDRSAAPSVEDVLAASEGTDLMEYSEVPKSVLEKKERTSRG